MRTIEVATQNFSIQLSSPKREIQICRSEYISPSDDEPPRVTSIQYYPSIETSENVEVLIVISKLIRPIPGRMKVSEFVRRKEYSENIEETITIEDLGGLTGEFTVNIDWIIPTPVEVEKTINVRFFDTDGSVIANDWYGVGENVIYPSPPTREHLTFVGRTHTQEELNNLQYRPSERGIEKGHIDVGAVYKTSDDKTHIFFTARQAYSMTLGIYFSKVASSNAQMNIDFGDGSPVQSFSLTGAMIKTRIYTQEGHYHVTVWSDGNVEHGLGNGTASTQVCTTGNLGVSKIYISDFAVLKPYSFNAMRGLSEVSLPAPSGLNTAINNNSFTDCDTIQHITIPRGYNAIPNTCFQNCKCMESVVLPLTIQSFGTSAFVLTPKIERLVLPKGISEFTDSLFNTGSASEVISDIITKIGDNAFNSWFLSHTVNLAKKVNCSGTLTFANAYSLDIEDIELFFESTLSSTSLLRLQLARGKVALRGIAGLTLPQVSSFNSCTELTIGANFTAVTGAITSPKIMDYIFEGETPPTFANANNMNNTNFNKLATIRVPDTALNTYKTRPNLSGMAGYIRPKSENPNI